MQALTAEDPASYTAASEPSTAFSDLPVYLQSLVLALSGAPLHTCRAGAAIAEEPHLTALWLVARVGLPLWVAARRALWGACHHLLSIKHYSPSIQEVRAALVVLASNGQAQLVRHLLDYMNSCQAHAAVEGAKALPSSPQAPPAALSATGAATQSPAAAEQKKSPAVVDPGVLHAPLFAAVIAGHADVAEVLLGHLGQGAQVPGEVRGVREGPGDGSAG
jgi:hypothetical protein